MRQVNVKRRATFGLGLKKMGNPPVGWLATFAAVAAGSVLLVVAVSAYNHSTSSANLSKPAAAVPHIQASPQQSGKPYSRLSHQPEAERFRRSLGARFLGPGREKSTLIGTLSIGEDRSPVQIVRTQTDDGEQVEISIGSAGLHMSWKPTEGARENGRSVVGNTRAIIERLALDSPDEFVLAQLRGASYYTVARNVMPKSAGGSDDYAGPTWDIIRVGEPTSFGPDATLSRARSFHINTRTGLIDRCFSMEAGETIVAEFAEWVDQFGERVPTHITWSKNGQVLMELSLNGVSHGPKQ